jgi:biopolymer transport protein ExbB/TolQ
MIKKMAKKKNNLILIIPAFLLMGMALGIQTQSVLKQTIIGLIVGIIVYFFLSYRNKKINSNK